MTDTFTLTGRILDKSKAPVKRANLVLSSNTRVLRDTVTNEVYAPPPRVTTDDEGYLCIEVSRDTPADTPGVALVTGVQYVLRGVNEQLLGGRLVFTAPPAGDSLDIADIISEPPESDPSWSDRLAALEAGGGGTGGGGSIVEDPSNPGFYVIGSGGGLVADSAHPGFYLIGA